MNTYLLTHYALFLFSYHPHDIAYFETAVRIYHGKVFLSLFHSHNHEVIALAHIAFFERFANKRTIGSDDELLKFHLTMFDVGILRQ